MKYSWNGSACHPMFRRLTGREQGGLDESGQKRRNAAAVTDKAEAMDEEGMNIYETDHSFYQKNQKQKRRLFFRVPAGHRGEQCDYA